MDSPLPKEVGIAGGVKGASDQVRHQGRHSNLTDTGADKTCASLPDKRGWARADLDAKGWAQCNDGKTRRKREMMSPFAGNFVCHT